MFLINHLKLFSNLSESNIQIIGLNQSDYWIAADSLIEHQIIIICKVRLNMSWDPLFRVAVFF